MVRKNHKFGVTLIRRGKAGFFTLVFGIGERRKWLALGTTDEVEARGIADNVLRQAENFGVAKPRSDVVMEFLLELKTFFHNNRANPMKEVTLFEDGGKFYRKETLADGTIVLKPFIVNDRPAVEPPNKVKAHNKGRRGKRRKVWTSEEDRKIMALYREGLEPMAIATAMNNGRSAKSVSCRIWFLRKSGNDLPVHSPGRSEAGKERAKARREQNTQYTLLGVTPDNGKDLGRA